MAGGKRRDFNYFKTRLFPHEPAGEKLREFRFFKLNHYNERKYLLRVISGLYKGLKLENKYIENVRPTTDRVKESLFNILQFEIKNKFFLDLFGGTGQIGIEAASRGAEKVIIVDNNSNAINAIEKNISKIKNKKSIFIVQSSSDLFLKNNTDKFDIAFLDPPYSDAELLNKSLLDIKDHMRENSIVATESLRQTEILNYSHGFVLQNRYTYGKMALHIYVHQT
jgi:16S rRNA (guanine(966)-N(2))-methyltransferase RsmD